MTLLSLVDVAFRVFAAWQAVWSLVAFVAVWRDKQLAGTGAARIPERELHRLEAWGGWAGSFAAQQLFRHKVRKQSYQRVFIRLTTVWLVAWVVAVALRFTLG